MNLGATYLQAFLLLCLLGTLIALVIAIVLAWGARRRLIGFLAFPVLAMVLNSSLVFFLQQSAFARLHQRQNRFVPRGSICLEYQPTFNTLHARYPMTPMEFDEWIKKYPIPLTAMDEADSFDEARWNVTFNDRILASERGASGKQMRIYYQDGVAYVSYNAW